MSLSKKQTLKERLEGFQTVDDHKILNKFKSAIDSGLKLMKEYAARREGELEQLAQDPKYHRITQVYVYATDIFKDRPAEWFNSKEHKKIEQERDNGYLEMKKEMSLWHGIYDFLRVGFS